jgi:calcineurin-like phosphoesterase family protein
MSIFFTSDQHLDHANRIKYDNLPFTSVEEMDETMIARWNEVVGIQDTVYQVGDFTLGDDAKKYINRLNGKIKFVVPDFHHDARWVHNTKDGRIEILPPIYVQQIRNVWICMCHYPLAVWDRAHYGAWHIYGHVHHQEFVLPGFAINVAAHLHGFYPLSFEEVKQHMVKLGWYPGWKADYIK